MNVDLSDYRTIVFDCDGVILNSNKIKTEAFYNSVISFGKDKAQELVDYHVQNGGVSRYLKFEYFIEKILVTSVTDELKTELLSNFADEVKKGLLKSEVASGLADLKAMTSDANWLIVSGGDQRELREVFDLRNMSVFFDGGIFGSPDKKEVILEREKGNKVIKEPALFIGDSKYDFYAAQSSGLDFLFVSDWTEVSDWQAFQQAHGFPVLKSVTALLAK